MNTFLSQILGSFVPQAQPAPTAQMTNVARAGNIEVWSPEGVAFNLAQPSPGVYVIVEYPEPTGPNVSGDGSFWGGVANAANSLTGGLINTIATYIPGAQKAKNQAEADRLAMLADAQTDAWEADQAAQVRAATAWLDYQKQLYKFQRRQAGLSTPGLPLEDLDSGEPMVPATIIPPSALLDRVAPSIAGACCASCARGGACEGHAHG